MTVWLEDARQFAVIPSAIDQQCISYIIYCICYIIYCVVL